MTFKYQKILPRVAKTPPLEGVSESATQTCQEIPEYCWSALLAVGWTRSPHQVTSSHLIMRSFSLTQSTNPCTILSSLALLAEIWKLRKVNQIAGPSAAMPCSAASALYGDRDHPIMYPSNCVVAGAKTFLSIWLNRLAYDAASKGFTFGHHWGWPHHCKKLRQQIPE